MLKVICLGKMLKHHLEDLKQNQDPLVCAYSIHHLIVHYNNRKTSQATTRWEEGKVMKTESPMVGVLPIIRLSCIYIYIYSSRPQPS